MTHHFDPIPIRIQNERNMLHPPVRQLLLERHAELLEPLAGGVHVVDGDGDVAESARFFVAVVVGSGFEGFGAVVVAEFEDA